MLNTSKEFQIQARKYRNFYVTANCTLADGTHLPMEKGDFYLSGNGIVDSSDSAEFPLGLAIEKTATLSLVNDKDQFSTYNFNRARFVIYINLPLPSGRVETLKKGTFIVSKKPTTGGRINLTLFDHMYLADKKYTTSLTFPATAGVVLRDSCQSCGIALGDPTFPNDDYIVKEAPENTTHRAVIGQCAMLAGGCARIDADDFLRIVSFDRDARRPFLDGGTFSPWTGGEAVDGGSFSPWTGGEVIDGGTFGDRDGVHVLNAITGLTYDTDDVEVTGVKAVVDGTEYLCGGDSYAVAVQPLLIKGDVDGALQRIGEKVIGLAMRPFSLQSVADPTVEFLDPCYFSDVRGRTYFSYATDVDFPFNGRTKISNGVKGVEENAAEFHSGNSVAVEQARRDAEKLLSAYDLGVRQMNQLAANTLGYFYTDRIDEGGRMTAYWHDLPELSQSKTVYKKGIDGFFVTRNYTGDDATTQWEHGFDKNGDAILNIIYARGINADYVTFGRLVVKKGDVTTLLADVDTGQVEIVADKFSLTSGETIDSIAQEKVEAGQTNAGNLLKDAIRLGDAYWVYAGKLTRSQADPDGGKNAVKLQADGTDCHFSANAETNRPLKASGHAYRFSVWLKAGAAKTKIKISIGGTDGLTSEIEVGTAWKLYSITAEIKTITADSQVVIGADGSFTASGKALYIYKPFVALSYTPSEALDILTGNGAIQGIFMEGGKLYVNGEFVQAKGFKAVNTDKKTTFYVDENGEVEIDAKSLRITGEGAATEGYVKSEVLSGINLLKDPLNLGDAYWICAGKLTRAQADPDGGKNAVRLQADGTDCHFSANAETNRPLKASGHAYQLCVWLKANAAKTKIKISLGGAASEIEVGTAWKLYSITAEIKTITADSQVVIGAEGSFTTSSRTLYIYKPSVTLSYTASETLNMLTDNGAMQGIFIENGKLYVNGEFVQVKGLKAVNTDKKTTFYVDENGDVEINAKSLKISGSDAASEAYADGAASDAVDRQTQADIFNKLTANGTKQGILLTKTGDLYINGSFIQTQGLKAVNASRQTTFYVDENGDVEINAKTLKISGSAAASQSYADDAAAKALEELGQKEVLDKLTNGGTDEGIYLYNRKLYISFSAARGGTLTLGGSNNTSGTLIIKSSGNSTIGSWDKDGIVAEAGTIGGFTLGKTRFYGADSAGHYVVLNKGSGSTSVAIAVGGGSATSYSDAPFKVTMAGKLYATGAEITGKLTTGAKNDVWITVDGNSITAMDSAGHTSTITFPSYNDSAVVGKGSVMINAPNGFYVNGQQLA